MLVRGVMLVRVQLSASANPRAIAGSRGPPGEAAHGALWRRLTAYCRNEVPYIHRGS
jgi:hypothetical protein